MDNFNIIVTARLKDNPVARFLAELGTNVRFISLRRGEFVLSSTVGVRYLERDQFINMIKSRSFYREAVELRKEFSNPIFIVEGEDPFHEPGIDSITMQSAILFASVVNRIPIMVSNNAVETAQMLFMLTGQIGAVPPEMMAEASADNKEGGKKETGAPQVTQKMLVEMLPEIGPAVATALLREFKSLSQLFGATIGQLKKVEGVGPKRAQKIYKFLHDKQAA